MKISIAYLPEEEREADRDVSALLQLHPGAKVRKSATHPPFKHTYVTTKKPPRKSAKHCTARDSEE